MGSKFLDWCIEQGCMLKRGSVSDFPVYGSGIVATESVSPGVDICVVPLSLLMNVHTAKQAPFWSVAESMCIDFSSDMDIVLCHLVFERNHAHLSRWRPYLNILGHPAVPLLASSEELLCIKNTSMHLELTKLGKAIDRLASKMSVVVAARPDLGPCGSNELRWALAVYLSRALSVLWTDGKTTGCLVPLADMLNHNGGAKVEYLTHSEQKLFSIRAQYAANVGDQLFLNYGCRTEEKMILNYGFTERNTPYFVESLCLRVALSPEDEFYAEKMAELKQRNLSLEMHILSQGEIEEAVAVCTVLCSGSKWEALGVLRGELQRLEQRLNVNPKGTRPISALHSELLLYAESQLRIAGAALTRVDDAQVQMIASRAPKTLRPIDFEFGGMSFMIGGKFAQTEDGEFVIALNTEQSEFRLRLSRTLLIDVPELNPEESENDLINALPPSAWLELLRQGTGQVDEGFGEKVFGLCGLEEGDDYFLAQIPCVPAFPTPEFSENFVEWTLPKGSSLTCLISSLSLL